MTRRSPKNLVRRLPRAALRITPPLLLVALSIHGGMAALSDWRDPGGSITAWLYIPSVMFASGRGLVNVAPQDVPGLLEFVEFETMEFDRDCVPEDLPIKPLDTYERYHRYLLYAAGWTWRLFGISWGALKILIVGLLCTATLLAYGIFRLGMNRGFSLAGAALFILTPEVTVVAVNLRDFSKAPFFLATVLILGLLCKKRPGLRAFLGSALLLGVVQGIGLGFRRDLAICLVPSVIVLAFCARRAPGKPFLHRLAAIGLLCASFVVSAWPILTSFREEGSLGYHDMLMGMSTFSDDQLGLDRASYERMYRLHDVYVYVSAVTYRERVGLPNSPTEPSDGKKELLIEMARTFPADMLVRPYAAIVRILGHGFPYGWDVCGVLCAAGVFLLLHYGGRRQAWLALFLVVYFCGYTCLQYTYRHCFHLYFLSFWLVGFLGQACVWFVWQMRPSVRRRQWPRLRRRVSFALRQGAVSCVCAGALFLVPLYGARIYQRQAVAEIIEKHAAADLEPIAVERRPWQGLALFRPTAQSAFQPCARAMYGGGLRATYLMAEFEVGETTPYFWIRYEGKHGANDFWSVLALEPYGYVHNQRVRYFFPVYEFMGLREWSHFVGLALSEKYEATFKGLYRVRNVDDFRLLLNLTVPEDMGQFRAYQKVRFAGLAYDHYFPDMAIEPEPAELTWRADDLLVLGRPEAAVKAYNEALKRYPEYLPLLAGLAETFEACGDAEAALRTYRRAIDVNPEAPVLYGILDAFLVRRNDAGKRLAEWRDVAAAHPDVPCSRFYLGRALEAMGDTEAAVQAYRQAGRLSPQDPSMPAAIDLLLSTTKTQATEGNGG